MLGKLIKHDFNALSRILFPLQIGILAAGILASLFMTINLRLGEAARSDSGELIRFAFTGVSAMLMVLIGIGIAASALVTILLICIQYYRNLLGDQGYLTFTLPTTTGRILWSKLITGMLWILINLAVIALTVLIFAVFGTASRGLMNSAVLETIRGVFTELPSLGQYVNMTLVYLLLFVVVILSLAEMLLQAYFAITVGGRASKHRLMASIGMFIALSAGVNTIRTISTIMFSIGPVGLLELATAESMGSWMFHSVLIWNGALAAGLCVLYFLCSRAILKNKLNLQ